MRPVIKDPYNPYKSQNKFGGGRQSDWYARSLPVPVPVPVPVLEPVPEPKRAPSPSTLAELKRFYPSLYSSPPTEQVITKRVVSWEPYKAPPTEREQLDKIIADAAAAAEAERVRIADEAAAATAAEQAAAQKKLARHKQTPEEREANKEKRLLKLVGAVVVKCMSKHQAQMDHDMFKKHAKEVRLLLRF